MIAERGAWETEVVGVAFDGTGYGEDGTIWGGEIFTGSVARGLTRVAHLRSALLPGGDAAARFPVQAAAGFLYELDGLPDLTAPPFGFPPRYRFAREMIAKDVRTFRTTSIGRLFDTVAALLGFTREITFEGQAAMWLEHLAAGASRDPKAKRGTAAAYAFPLVDGELDYRPLLRAIIGDVAGGRDAGAIAFGFHSRARRCRRGRARALRSVAAARCVRRRVPKSPAARTASRPPRNVALAQPRRPAERRRPRPRPSRASRSNPIIPSTNPVILSNNAVTLSNNPLSP